MNDPDQPLETRIIALVYSESFKPSKPKTIHKLLGLHDDEYVLLRKTIKKLVQRGQLAFASNHLVMRSDKRSDAKNKVQGTFRAAAGGFGFVRLSDPDPVRVQEDIFIPAKSTGSAMEGDLVSVRVVKSSGSERTEGVVEEILHRAKRQFVGTYQLVNNTSVVWLDGVASENPVTVGDVRGLPISNNDKVIVEMVRYPEAFQPGEAVIMQVLGASTNPAVDTLAVMHQFGLIDEFPEEVLDQAREMADKFSEEISEDRRDLTAVPTLTIDPTDARDFDDAISLAINDVGNWELMVHIADVAHFVPAGTALDEEAKRRATSVYLPDKVIPMLPEVISNHLASLQPDKVRMAKTVKMEISPEGLMLHSEVFNSAIKNAQRLNYEQVDQFLENPIAWQERLAPSIFDLLRHMHTLAMLLRRRRMAGGSIELTLPEVKIDLDKLGKVKGAHLVHHTESHQIIEEFMLAANQAVATFLDDLELPFLRRVHAPPQRLKLRRLYEFVRGLGIDCGDLQDRFEIQRVVESVKGQPTEQAVNYAVLKSMSKAVYQPQHERHYALDMSHYCHFTSPIRRYPDLVVHRIIQKIIEQKNASEPMPLLMFLGQYCSDREQNAEFAERELIRVKLLHFMSKRIDQEFQGTITAVKSDLILVRLHEIPVDGVIPLERLPPDRYRFDRQSHTMEGFRNGNRFRLGDELSVRVERVDLARRQLFFNFLSKLSSAPAPSLTQRLARAARSDADQLYGADKAPHKPGDRKYGKSPHRSEKNKPFPGKRGSSKKKRRKP